jgi:glycosyltransferase involved in cell wall biosynthesis/thiamine kinase-like enzyme
MNILYICADAGIPIRGHKGAAVHVRALTDAFVRAGHSVTIVTPRPGPVDGPAPLADLIVVPPFLSPLPHPLSPSPLAGEGDEGDSGEAQTPQYRALTRLLFAAALEAMERRAFDFIYERYSLWSDVGARLAQATGRPLVLEVNAPLRLEAARYRTLPDPERAAQMERTQFMAANAISVVSQALRDYVIGQGAPPERVHVLPNGVDPQRFHPAVRGGAVRDRLGLNDRIVIGFVGRPRPWHDLETLCAAFARLRVDDPRFHLLLVGEPPAALPEIIAERGLRRAVTLTGPVAHEDVPQYIAAMDVAVSPHPPLADFYFSPLKLFEYLACGVPTVAADIGQPAAIIRDGETGVLYPPGDAEALAERIRFLIAHPDRAREIAWNGAVSVLERYTWQGNARTVIGWVEAAMKDMNGQQQEGSVVPHFAVYDPGPGPLAGAPSLPILDPKLRQRLYRATRPDLAGPLLARRLPAFSKKGTEQLVGVQDIQVLKYKPGRRCVLAYTLVGQTRRGGAQRQHQVIGKVYRDERGERLFRLQQALWHDGFGPHAPDRIHVPCALAYVPEMRMVVQERATGATLNALVTAPGLRTRIVRSAEGLAKLHNTRWTTGEPLGRYLLADELANLDRFMRELAQARPPSAAAVSEIAEALRAWAQRLPALEAPTPIHRDFYYSQVLFDGPRLVLIDFDLFALGDPAIDVANFIAHLHFLGLDRLGHLDALAAEASAFMEAYARYRPVDAAFLRRQAFYQAATFFRLLHVVAPRPGLAQHFDTLYRRTVDCLEAA